MINVQLFLLSLLVIMGLTSCSSSEQEIEKKIIPEKKKSLDWLLGKWERTNEEKGKQTLESWEKVSESEYTGFAYTLQQNDTISYEIMKIVANEDSWELKVKTKEEKDFTHFYLAKLTDTEFEFKNDTIEFPSLIRYVNKKDKISALVSGKAFELKYEFKKIN